MTQRYSTPFASEDWSSPLPLGEGGLLLEWPKDVFPFPYGEFVEELSRSTETPIELSAMITLSAVATAAQRKYRVQIKPGYTEPVCIWTLVPLAPASRKSAVFSEVTAPLKDWEREKRKEYEPLIAAVGSKIKTIEARLKQLRIEAAKVKGEKLYKEAQMEIERLEKEAPEVMRPPQIWTGDVTPEYLGTLMSYYDGVMSLMSDEGGIFNVLGGLYSGGNANIDLFLQAHTGGAVRVNRGSRAPVELDSAILTMGLTIQPEVLRSICSNKTFRGRGLLGRFLYAQPESNIGKRTLDTLPMSDLVRCRYQSALKAILDVSWREEKRQDAASILTLNNVAYSKWLEYAKYVEMFMGEDLAVLRHISDWAGKLPGAIARIASLCHIMRYSHKEAIEYRISKHDMDCAVKIGHCLTRHALKVFDEIRVDEATEVAREIYDWAVRERREQFTFRDCSRKFRRFKKKQLEAGMDILTEKELLKRWTFQPEKGRSTQVCEMNLLIFENLK